MVNKGKPGCLGVYLSYPVPGTNEYRNLALRVRGSLKFEPVKYGRESHGLGHEEDCSGFHAANFLLIHLDSHPTVHLIKCHVDANAKSSLP
jgi:hypothetical protein